MRCTYQVNYSFEEVYRIPWFFVKFGGTSSIVNK